jgi:hypothetical protein
MGKVPGPSAFHGVLLPGESGSALRPRAIPLDPWVVSARAEGRSIETDDMVGMKPLESLVVEFLDELRKRALPGFLPVIVELPELLGVHAEFSCHLNVFVGQAMTPFCLDPRDHFLRDFGLAHNAPRAGLSTVRTPRLIVGPFLRVNRN